MKVSTAPFLLISLPVLTNAFTSHSFRKGGLPFAIRTPIGASRPVSSRLRADSDGATSANLDTENEIERLKGMAAKLRAEAAALEADQAQKLAELTQRAFEQFDSNRDGEISLEELKAGLEKVLKKELPDRQVKKLMQNFDASGDGALQPNEFVTIDQLRNKLDAIIREEKANALEAVKAAKKEEETVKFLQAQIELLNDREPSPQDKVLSILPYLFPLMDGLVYGKYLVLENLDNPVAVILGVIYSLYRSIPFSGFIAFFALSFLSNNPSINRLIRFNMQQAIFLDIALFFPGLLGALYSLVASGAGFKLPGSVAELGSDALFLTLLATIGYASVSSLLGQTPDKIPFISQAANDRMPTIDMFDESGRFIPRQQREEKQKNADDTDEKKDSQ